MPRYSKFIPFIALTGDLLLLNLFFVAGLCVYFPEVDCFRPNLLPFYLYLNGVWLVLAFVLGAQNFERNIKKVSLLLTYTKLIVFFFFFFLLYFQVNSLQYYPRSTIKFIFPFFYVSLLVWKFSLYYAFYFYRKLGFNYRSVIVIGLTPTSQKLIDFFLGNKWHGYRLIGIFDQVAKHKMVVGSLDALPKFLTKNHVDEAYLNLKELSTIQIQHITEALMTSTAKIRLIPEMEYLIYKNVELVDYGHIPVIQVHQGPLVFWYNTLLKRMVDIVLSIVVISTLLSWLTVVVYILTKTTRGGNLFFRQKRTRIDGKEFWCLKFSSMHSNADETKQATKNDPRVTKVGKFLRTYSLDELPQFINVLLGDMSVVGPRPHMLKHTEDYRRLVTKFMLRHTVKPGITGLAQVNGYRGEIKQPKDLEKRVELDVNYIENWTLNLDLKIMVLTIWYIFKGQPQAY